MNSDKAHRIIKEIANTSGHNKHSILSMNPNLGKYLLAAYDPYTRYYITKCAKGKGDSQFDELTWGILDQLSDRRISGIDAKTLVFYHTEEMTPRSAELFGMILKKDMRMGMGIKSINKVLPGLIPAHNVMLAKPTFEPHKVKYPCFGSPKIDGVRAIFKMGKFYSRNGHPYKGLEHLQEQLKIAGITGELDGELDGELVVPGVSFQISSGQIRSNNPTPNAEFKLIELPTIKDRYIVRLTLMRDLHLAGPNIHHIPHEKLDSLDEIYKYYKLCRKHKYEGIVVTPYDYNYTGTRSWDWMKLKPKETYDAKIIDIYPGKPGTKYEFEMGGVTVMFKGKLNKVGGGWSDRQRLNFSIKPELIIGKMIEIHYMEETDDGNMRHARFFDFRPDKEV